MSHRDRSPDRHRASRSYGRQNGRQHFDQQHRVLRRVERRTRPRSPEPRRRISRSVGRRHRSRERHEAHRRSPPRMSRPSLPHFHRREGFDDALHPIIVAGVQADVDSVHRAQSDVA